MYDRHKPIIKWYEYDARKLYQTAEADDVTDRADAKEADPAAAGQAGEAPAEAVEASGGQDAPLSGSELDDEVARIMAAFSGAKQNGVDDVFAMMAAEVEAGGSVGDSEGPGDGDAEAAPAEAQSEEDLLASILAPKQNGVDDLVAKAREG
jgi:hypothetical protein